MSLFRKQAIEHHRERLLGQAILLPQLSHIYRTAALAVLVVLILIWLLSSSYARKESVVGWLEPPMGVVRMYSETTGVVQKIFVAEGEYVNKDQPLMLIHVQANLDSGEQLSVQLLKEYQEQTKNLDEQISNTQKLYDDRVNDLREKINSASRELQILKEQSSTLAQRYELLLSQSERYKSLMRDGHVSAAMYEQINAEKLKIKSEHQEIMRQEVSQQNIITNLNFQKRNLPTESKNAVSLIQGKRIEIAQQMIELSGQSAQIVKAAGSGLVNNLQTREGQYITAGNMLLMTLMPQDINLNAVILVPIRSAGFIEVGQPINIRYDAFPFEKFGFYEGEIDKVSKTILLPNELINSPVSAQEPMYRITAKLKSSTARAYGKDFPLKPGMTLGADITLSERTLMQWLLEPLFSLQGRI